MGIKENLDEDLKSAMRDRDELRRSVLRVVRSEIHNEEINLRRELDDEGILGVISSQVKRHRESISEFRKGNRDDLVGREEEELNVLLAYMPKQLEPDEILVLARDAVNASGAQGPGDKGKVMGRLMPQVKGKADGNIVNSIVTEILEAM
mgnify:CR=1 FL=1|tara:strand:+ start:609 stop:1058 length:450 start_codon:yes stop_codon:yes gene_type:complete